MTEETVTTAEASGRPMPTANLAYSEPITADTIKVTFNGVEYTCDRQPTTGDAYYGASPTQAGADWSTYPFLIMPVDMGGYNLFATETAGTYRVKIENPRTVVETSDCFKKAVQSVTGAFIVDDVSAVGGDRLDKTYAEIEEAFLSGRKVLVRKNGVYSIITNMGMSDGSFIVETSWNVYRATEPTDYPSYSEEPK